jgi:hypothetical protein
MTISGGKELLVLKSVNGELRSPSLRMGECFNNADHDEVVVLVLNAPVHVCRWDPID